MHSGCFDQGCRFLFGLTVRSALALYITPRTPPLHLLPSEKKEVGARVVSRAISSMTSQ